MQTGCICATVTGGLRDRGQIREGALADIPALFNPDMVLKKGKVLQW